MTNGILGVAEVFVFDESETRGLPRHPNVFESSNFPKRFFDFRLLNLRIEVSDVNLGVFHVETLKDS